MSFDAKQLLSKIYSESQLFIDCSPSA